ncbi:diacylglycerol/polyprenol kinase family protein [Clostridium polynesiense]|uniref:diacylglycerol/polyprenol kinase family protein n=1 Tax=Clostridium polynesiense TaxID=1325933 RepID=UPI000AF9EE9E|nr:hypothetical protein [Clostridium polynesiense]
MMNNIIGIAVSILFVFLIIGASTILTKKNIINGELSRKFIHIGVANWWIIAMIFFDSPLYACIVPGIFVVINYISYKKNVFKVMERDGSRRDLGTVYYAISLFILSLITFRQGSAPYIGAIGILIMGYGDGLAAIVGGCLGKREIKLEGSTKTLEGTFTMFLVSFIVSFIILYNYHPFSLITVSLVLGAAAALLELFTPEGFDNITVPLGTSFLYMIIFALM